MTAARRPVAAIAVVGAMVGLVAACGVFGGGPEEPAPDVREALTVESQAFAGGQPIPRRYSCKGRNVSPPLAWSGAPSGTRALALVVSDPDAPRGTYYHWVVLDIDPTLDGVAEGAVPAGGAQAENSAGDSTYDGPCPPSGTHDYWFTVYALGSRTGLAAGASLEDALHAVDQRAIAKGALRGTFTAD